MQMLDYYYKLWVLAVGTREVVYSEENNNLLVNDT